MYKSIRNIKKEANAALSKKRVFYILMMSISTSVVSLFSTSGLLSFLGIIFLVLFQVGMNSFLLKLCCGQKEQAQFNDLFCAFNGQQGYASKAILLYLLQYLYLLPATIICIALLFVFAFMEAIPISDIGTLTTMSSSSAFVIFASVVIIALFLYSLYITITYSMASFVLLDYPDLTTWQIWNHSTRILKGKLLRYIGLELSYILYYIAPIAITFTGALLKEKALILIGVMALAICSLWVTPNMSCAKAIFYLDLARNHARSANTTE